MFRKVLASLRWIRFLGFLLLLGGLNTLVGSVEARCPYDQVTFGDMLSQAGCPPGTYPCPNGGCSKNCR